jgi:pyruvate,water dikinase
MTGAPVPMTDPLHTVSSPSIAWTRVNIAEGQPGVNTPLSWTWWREEGELMMRTSYRDTGVPMGEMVPPEDVDERMCSIFYGRPALNVDVTRRGADMMPFLSGDDLELHFFGAVRPGVTSRKTKRYYPLIATKTVPLIVKTPKLLQRYFAENEPVWREQAPAAEGMSASDARRVFIDARMRFRRISRPHSNVAWICAPLFAALTGVAMSVERLELLTSIFGGHESLEMKTTIDLWDVSRDRLSLEEFLRRHGFQGPMQGAMQSRSWREDPSVVERLVATYRTMPEDADPRNAERQSIAARMAAERDLLAALPVSKRAWAQTLLKIGHTYIPLRNVGKAGLQQMLDLGRAAARGMGREYAGQGLLEDPEDIFSLTIFEVEATALPSNAKELVAFRRAKRDEYLSFEIPESWVGNPEPILEPTVESDEPVTGIPVSPGVHEGAARVLLDPLDDVLEPDEVLVCVTTDPSYASYFLVAGACVIDVGGPLSHGAIAAREVGIPCVIGTRDGTKRIRTGDRVRVDGNTGTVEILSRDSRPSAAAGED